MSEYTIKDLEKIMEKELPHKRYLHTLGVEHTAACLAMCYDADLTQARTAGVLHDCAKCIDEEETIRLCEKFTIPITDTEYKLPYLLHGKLGAYYGSHRFHIENSDVLSAIVYHTTGKPAMSLLEKIVFVADYMEPGRKIVAGLEKVRSVVFHDLDEAVYLTFHHTIEYLTSGAGQRSVIDEMTLHAYDYYKNLHKQKM